MAGTAEDVARLAPIARRLREHVIEFGESGSGEALYAKHGLDAPGIVAAARRFLEDVRGVRGQRQAGRLQRA